MSASVGLVGGAGGWALQKLMQLPDLKAVLPRKLLSLIGKPICLPYCYVLKTSVTFQNSSSHLTSAGMSCGRLDFILDFERHFSLGENFFSVPCLNRGEKSLTKAQ